MPMKRIAIITESLLATAAVAHASMPTAQLPRPPRAPGPIVSTPASSGGGQRLIGWRAGPISCAGSPVVPRALPAVPERLGWTQASDTQPNAVTLRFDIDSGGRPHGIGHNGPIYIPYSDDLEATLATASFAAGVERSGCTMTYELESIAIDAAPVERLIAYSLFPGGQPLPQTGFERIRSMASANSTCGDPLPQVRRRSYPDFKAIPQAPATRSWSMIGFDIDPRGKPVSVRVFRSTGNGALDRASVQAVAESRFEPGARRGCLYPYWRTGPTLTAPAIPETPAEQTSATCPVASQWKTQPVLRFPEQYRRHGVEGWAVIAYDVAPWGQTGNLRVVASEPSGAFGAAAINTVRAATKEASPQGYSNCITRVRFVLALEPRPGSERATVTPPPPPF